MVSEPPARSAAAPPVPAPLRAVAHAAGNGELFWPPTVAGDAARAIAAAGSAIVGGEIYRLHEQAWASYVDCWTTTPGRGRGEPWQDFVARSLLQAIAQLDIESAAADADARLLFFFASATLSEYEHDVSFAAGLSRG